MKINIVRESCANGIIYKVHYKNDYGKYENYIFQATDRVIGKMISLKVFDIFLITHLNNAYKKFGIYDEAIEE